MAFEVIPFCRIVKFSGITRFLYQFWKILPKYCGRKEKDHNILWSKWYSRRESNPQRPLRRGLLYPFNYGSIFYYPAREYFVAALLVPPQAVGRTRNDLLCLYEEAYFIIPPKIRRRAWNALYFTTFRAKRQLFSRGKFESAPALPRSRFLSENIIQTLDNEAGICIIKLDMIQMVCSGSAAAGREGI